MSHVTKRWRVSTASVKSGMREASQRRFSHLCAAPMKARLSRLMVEATILLAASRQNGTSVLKDAATLYKVNTEAIGQKIKQEFAAKAKVKKEPKPEAKPVAKAKKAA